MKKLFLTLLICLLPVLGLCSGLYNSYLPISGGTLTGPLTFPSSVVGNSLFKVRSLFGTVSNDTFQIGYNLSDTLYVPNNLAEPQMWLGFETNYLNGNPTSEMYLRIEPIGNSTGVQYTGFLDALFINYDRVTGRILNNILHGDQVTFMDTLGNQLASATTQNFTVNNQILFTPGGAISGTSSGPVIYSQNLSLSARFYNGVTYFNGPINFKNLADNAFHMIINDSGVLNMGSSPITNLTDPTNAQDAATKNYVDNIFKGAVTFVNALTTPVTQVIAGCSSTSSFAFGEKGAALASSFGWTSPQATTIVFNGTFAGAATISYIGMK